MKYTYYQPYARQTGPAHAAEREPEAQPADESGPAPLQGPGLNHRKCCPLCAEPLIRMHRTAMDRMVSLLVPVHRYRCYNFNCNWEGVLQVGPAAWHGVPAKPPKLHA